MHTKIVPFSERIDIKVEITAELKIKVSCFYWQRLTTLVCDVPVTQSLSVFGVNSDAMPVQTQPGGLHQVG